MTQQTPGQPAPGAGAAQLSTGSYEFTDAENVSIERAATSSTIWAVCAMVGAVLLGTLACTQFFLDNVRGAILVVPLFLVCAVAGWLYLDTGRALKAVVNTEGNDVELLMRALERMARAFRLEVIVTGIAVVIFVGLAVATMI
jgi:xanthine/uracil permease